MVLAISNSFIQIFLDSILFFSSHEFYNLVLVNISQKAESQGLSVQIKITE